MDYVLDGRTFSISYRALKEEHTRLCEMDDATFLASLPDALHLACVVCFLKERPTYLCLSDTGIVHELVHLLGPPDGNPTLLADVRALFLEALRLA